MLTTILVMLGTIVICAFLTRPSSLRTYDSSRYRPPANPVNANSKSVNLSEQVPKAIEEDKTTLLREIWANEYLAYLDGLSGLRDLLSHRDVNSIGYHALLSCFEWKYKRLTILKRDDFTCADCKRKNISNHVHHTYYVDDSLPWDIEPTGLITLCNDCHNKRHENSVIPVQPRRNSSATLATVKNLYCPHCHGSGYLPQFKHVENGICFKCRGDCISPTLFSSVLHEIKTNLNQYNQRQLREEYKEFLSSLKSITYKNKLFPETRFLRKHVPTPEQELDLPF